MQVPTNLAALPAIALVLGLGVYLVLTGLNALVQGLHGFPRYTYEQERAFREDALARLPAGLVIIGFLYWALNAS